MFQAVGWLAYLAGGCFPPWLRFFTYLDEKGGVVRDRNGVALLIPHVGRGYIQGYSVDQLSPVSLLHRADGYVWSPPRRTASLCSGADRG
ncbi:hypothetical protein BT67DRAFT_267157 [Trichocladium antarcticum]|uniref:Uncharacterized protein n=1 Tax=Trichocladium antarcticum TaxID=1450529 RepID=A0AAN6UBA3_9PEZI|nr:hypothetical protein BT67DRAFT_267157 [Trichocladium antarcticum]